MLVGIALTLAAGWTVVGILRRQQRPPPLRASETGYSGAWLLRVLVPLLRNQTPRRAGVVVLHLILWAAAFSLALALRFEGAVPPSIVSACVLTLLTLMALRLAIFAYLHLFDGLWRYTGMPELQRLILASSASTVLTIALEAMLAPVQRTPRSLFVGEWLASIVAVGGVRMLIRSIHERLRGSRGGTPVLVIGAGDAGESLVRELQKMRGGGQWQVVAFLDDDPAKQGMHMHAVPVLGPPTEERLRALIKQRNVELAVLAMPTADGVRIRELVALCRKLGLRVKTVPSLAERMSGESHETIREIDIEDLLGRPAVQLDMAQIAAFLEGKVVLVTGAGGSIGSELARQALQFRPRQLLLLDHDENAIFQIERELRQTLGPALADDLLKPLIIDVTNQRRVAWMFDRYRPQVVLHAAAHKHVAMMETNACEAAWNNAFGTQTLAEAAHAAGAEAFVLISTDKAVNPTSVMGATKRVCELVIQDVARRSRTRFAAVRFGNVLGSSGSVVPIFREQIARGGPVTVTHPEVTRYFMSIPEAVRLVLQAGALGGSGDIFLLDMGKPIKIVDLARDLIELSGLRPGIDIQIEFSGLKSGEKLFEEMLLQDESSDRPRPHPQIVAGSVHRLGVAGFTQGMSALALAIRTNDDAELRRALAAMIPEARLTMPEHTDASVRSILWERPRQPHADSPSSEQQASADLSRTPRSGVRTVND